MASRGVRSLPVCTRRLGFSSGCWHQVAGQSTRRHKATSLASVHVISLLTPRASPTFTKQNHRLPGSRSFLTDQSVKINVRCHSDIRDEQWITVTLRLKLTQPPQTKLTLDMISPLTRVCFVWFCLTPSARC